MLNKPTTNDIARVAGVSLATVDRVLNGRSGTSQKSIDRVQAAIAELGYVRDRAATNLARGRFYNLHFILPDSDNEFITSIVDEITNQSLRQSGDRTAITITKVKAFDPEGILKILRSIDPSTCQGIAIFGPQTAEIDDAIASLRAQNIATVALVSNLPDADCDHFVGIDNVAAGATAAKLLGKFVGSAGGDILVITGSPLAHDHVQRRSGFDHVMKESFPSLNLLPSLEGRDDPAYLRSLLPDVLRDNPEIRGIYSSAAGNEGLIAVLKEQGLADNIAVIGHELTNVSARALQDGVFDAIISQDTGHLVRSSVRLLKSTIDKIPHDPAQERIRIDIYLKENMPQGISQT